MESVIKINRSEANYLWIRFDQGICKECGEYLYFKYHGNPRTLNIEGREESVINCYYECRNQYCKNEEIVVAKHPEILYKKLYSRSMFALVIYLRYVKKFSVKQILEELSYLKIGMCYEMINTYRAAARVRADERIAQKFPPGSKLRVSIDAMEPEKGQPALYTVREVSEDELLGARFLEDSSADAIYGLLKEIEEKYGVKFVGFVSDKQTGIVAMHDKYYPKVPHQYCVVHFLDNVTKEMREIDNTFKKDLRSDVRNINTFTTIKKKARNPTTDLAENERAVLSDTRRALLAVVNQKKKDKFELAGTAIFENLTKATDWLCDFMAQNIYLESSRKFQILLTHVIERLQVILKKYRNTYRFVLLANQYLHPIFSSVTNSHPKHPKRAFENVIKSWKKILARKKLSKKMRGLLNKALNYALSYERGLFVWRKAKLPKTNNGTEIFYHEKKGEYRRNSPNQKIGTTLMLTAPEEMCIPKDLTEEEILSSLDWVGSTAYWQVRAEMRNRTERRRFNRYCRKDIRGALAEIFKRLEND
jgi:hypothetical protein